MFSAMFLLSRSYTNIYKCHKCVLYSSRYCNMLEKRPENGQYAVAKEILIWKQVVVTRSTGLTR